MREIKWSSFFIEVLTTTKTSLARSILPRHLYTEVTFGTVLTHAASFSETSLSASRLASARFLTVVSTTHNILSQNTGGGQGFKLCRAF